MSDAVKKALEEFRQMRIKGYNLMSVESIKVIEDTLTQSPPVGDNGLAGCPFCGGKAVQEITICDNLVRCDWCKATITRKNSTTEAIQSPVTAWNRRVTLAKGAE